jgi:hypothetical protein
MTSIICQNCGSLFYGRPNRAYCSPSCKSAANNRSYTERNTDARQTELKVRANRRILLDLYNVFQDEPFPITVIEKSKLDTDFNNGVSADGSVFIFLDVALKELPNKNCRILKKPAQ